MAWSLVVLSLLLELGSDGVKNLTESDDMVSVASSGGGCGGGGGRRG